MIPTELEAIIQAIAAGRQWRYDRNTALSATKAAAPGATTDGRWITLKHMGSAGEMITHVHINGDGVIDKGPSALNGANIAHLPEVSGLPGKRTMTVHPEGHEPRGAKNHPSYGETASGASRTVPRAHVGQLMDHALQESQAGKALPPMATQHPQQLSLFTQQAPVASAGLKPSGPVTSAPKPKQLSLFEQPSLEHQQVQTAGAAIGGAKQPAPDVPPAKPEPEAPEPQRQDTSPATAMIGEPSPVEGEIEPPATTGAPLPPEQAPTAPETMTVPQMEARRAAVWKEFQQIAGERNKLKLKDKRYPELTTKLESLSKERADLMGRIKQAQEGSPTDASSTASAPQTTPVADTAPTGGPTTGTAPVAETVQPNAAPESTPATTARPEPTGSAANSTVEGEVAPAKRGRGRPKGSTNKPKTPTTPASPAEPVEGEVAAPEDADATPQFKQPKNDGPTGSTPAPTPELKGRGRPKGSKNKPKQPDGPNAGAKAGVHTGIIPSGFLKDKPEQPEGEVPETPAPTPAPQTPMDKEAARHAQNAVKHISAIQDADKSGDEGKIDAAYGTLLTYGSSLSAYHNDAYQAALSAAQEHITGGGTPEEATAKATAAAHSALSGENSPQVPADRAQKLASLAAQAAVAESYQHRGVEHAPDSDQAKILARDHAVHTKTKGREHLLYREAHHAAAQYIKDKSLYDAKHHEIAAENAAVAAAHATGHVEGDAPTPKDTKTPSPTDRRNSLARAGHMGGLGVGGHDVYEGSGNDRVLLGGKEFFKEEHQNASNLLMGKERQAYMAAFHSTHDQGGDGSAAQAAAREVWKTKGKEPVEGEPAKVKKPVKPKAPKAEAEPAQSTPAADAGSEGETPDFGPQEKPSIPQADFDYSQHLEPGHTAQKASEIASRASSIVRLKASAKHWGKDDAKSITAQANDAHQQHLANYTGEHRQAYQAAHANALDYQVRMDHGKGLNNKRRDTQTKNATTAAHQILRDAEKARAVTQPKPVKAPKAPKQAAPGADTPMATEGEVPVKRGRGRPKGVKNKPKVADDAQSGSGATSDSGGSPAGGSDHAGSGNTSSEAVEGEVPEVKAPKLRNDAENITHGLGPDYAHAYHLGKLADAYEHGEAGEARHHEKHLDALPEFSDPEHAAAHVAEHMSAAEDIPGKDKRENRFNALKKAYEYRGSQTHEAWAHRGANAMHNSMNAGKGINTIHSLARSRFTKQGLVPKLSDAIGTYHEQLKAIRDKHSGAVMDAVIAHHGEAS